MKKIGKNQFSGASYKFIKTSILDNKWLVGKKIFNPVILLCSICLCFINQSFVSGQASSVLPGAIIRLPADKAINVYPDTHLKLTFNSTPILGKSGQIRIYFL